MKKFIKYFFTAISVLLIIFVLNFTFGTYTTHSIYNYMRNIYYSDEYAQTFMPELDSLENCGDISFTYKRKNKDFSTICAYVLKVQYNSDNYSSYRDEAIENHRLDKEYTTVGSANVYLCYDDLYDFPFTFGMMGFDDSQNTIIYMYFVDESNQNSDLSYLLDTYFKDNDGKLL